MSEVITEIRNDGALDSDRGSPFWCLFMWKDGTTLFNSADRSNTFKMPKKKSIDFKYTQPGVKDKFEDATPVWIRGGDITAEITAVDVQGDAASKDFTVTYGGRYCCVGWEESIDKIGGKAQMKVAPYCYIPTEIEIKKMGHDHTKKFQPMALPVDISVDLSTAAGTGLAQGFFNGGMTGAGYTIPANTIYKSYEY